jgi:hypothetical protein
MLRRFRFRISVVAAGLGLVIGALSATAQDTDKRGRKYKAPPPTSTIAVTVMRSFDGKPIENAAVVFHPMQGEKDKGAMELKTDEDGKTTIDVIPIGDTVLLQVLARGYQTFGRECKIDKPNMAFQVKLKRPGEQYSIYAKHPEKTEGGDTLQVTDSCSSIGSESADATGSQDAPKDKSADPSAKPPQSSQPNSQ